MNIIQSIKDFHNRKDLQNNLLYQGFKKFEILTLTAALVAATAYTVLGAAYFMPLVIHYSFVAMKFNLTLSLSLLALYHLSQATSWLGDHVKERLKPVRSLSLPG